jgi:hypothetical protein
VKKQTAADDPEKRDTYLYMPPLGSDQWVSLSEPILEFLYLPKTLDEIVTFHRERNEIPKTRSKNRCLIFIINCLAFLEQTKEVFVYREDGIYLWVSV